MKKNQLDEKICVICKRPFSWRKKWKNIWAEVKYCSKKCRNNKNLSNKNNDKNIL